MNRYASNSHKAKAAEHQSAPQPAPTEPKRVQKVAKGAVTVKKKSELSKLAETFLPDDLSRIKDYILRDVLVPSIKRFISDTVNVMLYNNPRGTGGSSGSQTAYTRYYGNDGRDTGSRDYSGGVTVPSCSAIKFRDKRDAEAVLAQLDELMEVYKQVCVADVYDLAGVSCDYTYHDYGWYNIRTAGIGSTRDGFYIDMPKAVPIRK